VLLHTRFPEGSFDRLNAGVEIQILGSAREVDRLIEPEAGDGRPIEVAIN